MLKLESVLSMTYLEPFMDTLNSKSGIRCPQTGGPTWLRLDKPVSTPRRLQPTPRSKC